MLWVNIDSAVMALRMRFRVDFLLTYPSVLFFFEATRNSFRTTWFCNHLCISESRWETLTLWGQNLQNTPINAFQDKLENIKTYIIIETYRNYHIDSNQVLFVSSPNNLMWPTAAILKMDYLQISATVWPIATKCGNMTHTGHLNPIKR